MRRLLVLLLVLVACAPAGEVASSTLNSGEESSSSATAVSTLPMFDDGREHFLTPGLPEPAELPGYGVFEFSDSLPWLSFEPGCTDEEVLDRYDEFGLGALNLTATGPGGALEIGLRLASLEDPDAPVGSFEDSADGVVVGLVDGADGCVLRGDEDWSPVEAEPGPEIDGLRELTVWRARSDDGHAAWAHFSMTYGIIGSIQIRDSERPVGFEDLRPLVENVVARQPPLLDRLNGCLEWFSDASSFLRRFFVAAPGTAPLARDGDECANINFDYIERRGWTIDGSANQLSTLELVSEQTISVGATPLSPLVTSGKVWVPNFTDGTVSVIDVETLEVVATVAVGLFPSTPVESGGAVWVSNSDDDSVSVIDTESFEVVATLGVGASPSAPIVAGGMVWVPNRLDGSLSVIDPTGREVVDTVLLSDPSADGYDSAATPLAADGELWVPNAGGGSVVVIDIETREVVDEVPVGEAPQTPVAAGEMIWVPNVGSSSLSVIEAETRTVAATIAVGEYPGTPVAAGGLMWVPAGPRGPLTVIDIELLEVVDIAVPNEISGPLRAPMESDGLIWFPDSDSVAVFDVDRRRIRQSFPVGRFPLRPVMAGGMVWVPNAGESSVTILETRVLP